MPKVWRIDDEGRNGVSMGLRTMQRPMVAEPDGVQAAVDALKSRQSETAAELDALLRAILEKAFKGEL